MSWHVLNIKTNLIKYIFSFHCFHVNIISDIDFEKHRNNNVNIHYNRSSVEWHSWKKFYVSIEI